MKTQNNLIINQVYVTVKINKHRKHNMEFLNHQSKATWNKTKNKNHLILKKT